MEYILSWRLPSFPACIAYTKALLWQPTKIDWKLLLLLPLSKLSDSVGGATRPLARPWMHASIYLAWKAFHACLPFSWLAPKMCFFSMIQRDLITNRKENIYSMSFSFFNWGIFYDADKLERKKLQMTLWYLRMGSSNKQKNQRETDFLWLIAKSFSFLAFQIFIIRQLARSTFLHFNSAHCTQIHIRMHTRTIFASLFCQLYGWLLYLQYTKASCCYV